MTPILDFQALSPLLKFVSGFFEFYLDICKPLSFFSKKHLNNQKSVLFLGYVWFPINGRINSTLGFTLREDIALSTLYFIDYTLFHYIVID
jgi:hypothetical protein